MNLVFHLVRYSIGYDARVRFMKMFRWEMTDESFSMTFTWLFYLSSCHNKPISSFYLSRTILTLWTSISFKIYHREVVDISFCAYHSLSHMRLWSLDSFGLFFGRFSAIPMISLNKSHLGIEGLFKDETFFLVSLAKT